MSLLDVVVLGPDGHSRNNLEETIRRLGHSAVGLDPATVAGLPPTHGDVLMLDLRGEDRSWNELTTELLDDERPLVIVADQARRMVQTLAGRAAGTLLLTGGEDDSGFRVAFTLCSALCASSRPATPPSRSPSWSLPGALRAATAF